MDHIPAMLLGATFVLLGVLGSALADRIRGVRTVRHVSQRENKPAKASRPASAPQLSPVSAHTFATDRRVVIPVVRAADVTSSEDVTAFLVGAGYSKATAAKAVAACSAQERATQELWLAAALRRVAGSAS